MKRIGWIIVAAAAGLALVGCATSAPEPPSAEPDIRGVVTLVSDAGDGASFRVVWTNDDAIGAQADYDAAQVTANADTGILSRAADGSVSNAAIGDIAVGTVVEAWFEGPVAESYPVQATAGTIVIIGSYSGELPEPPGLQ
ncbi:MAG TPA: hypothetical protein ENN10_04730 [Actinobacteria bacterium]|nr:hypothetical protein [Actinomycetota bacterium]